jgi:drug/metabolite transporter (DMT)-like permease
MNEAVLPAITAPRRGAVPAALFTAVLAISFAASFFKQAAPTHPVAMAGIRLAIAAAVLLPFSIRALRRGRLRGPALGAAVLAGVAYGAHFGAWVSSLTLTSVAASVTLVTTTPILLAAASLVTGTDRPTPRLWAALALAVVGVALIGGTDGLLAPDALLGDGLALLGAASIACYFVISRRQGANLDVWAYSGIACAVGAATLLGSGALAGIDLRPATDEALLYIVLAAVVPQLIGHSLLTWSLRHATPTQVAMAVVGEPAGATFIAWVWLGEEVGLVTALGCIITLAAVVFASLRRES